MTTAKTSEFAEYKGTPVYTDLLEIEGQSIRRDIANCLDALKRRVDTNRKLDQTIFTADGMYDCFVHFLGEYVNINE